MIRHGASAARAVAALLVVAFVLRVAHLAYMLGAPTTFQLGADEAFYLHYARTILAGGDVVTPEFVFMDPLYAYLLAGAFGVFGESLPAVLFAQVLVDVVTAFLVWRIAADLGQSRAGLIAAALYALCATAIFYSCTLLRESWVACAMAAWTWGALRLARAPRASAAFAFGLFCGLAVALRSNLVLLGVAAVVL
ncbi:MAG TPA: glycosyltransferase family 39 protein, partial [Tahibacter sp.]|nr:glycosyltransferase family 39 protein [Tahibacter sp.]